MPKKSRPVKGKGIKINRPIGFFAMALNVIFWGIAPVVIKLGVDVVPPHVFLFYRFFIVVACTTPFLFLFRKHLSYITSKQLGMLLFIGTLTNPLSLIMLFVGIQYTTSAAAALLAATSPLFIMLGSWLFLKEKITKKEVVGVAIAGAGMVLIIAETPVQTHALNPVLGNTLIFLQNVFWMGGVLLMKKYAHAFHPFVFGYTGWLSAFIIFGIYTAIASPIYFFRPLLLTQLPDAYIPILYMAFFGSIVAFSAYQFAQKHMSAPEVSIFTYLEPLITIPFSVLFLNERLGGMFVIGSIFLICGVLVAELHSSSRLKRLLFDHFEKHKR